MSQVLVSRFTCIRVEFPASVDDIPIPYASGNILTLLKQRADTLLQQLEPDKVFSTQVARLLVASFENGEPNRGFIAQKLRMSARSLQRKLAYSRHEPGTVSH